MSSVILCELCFAYIFPHLISIAYFVWAASKKNRRTLSRVCLMAGFKQPYLAGVKLIRPWGLVRLHTRCALTNGDWTALCSALLTYGHLKSFTVCASIPLVQTAQSTSWATVIEAHRINQPLTTHSPLWNQAQYNIYNSQAPTVWVFLLNMYQYWNITVDVLQQITGEILLVPELSFMTGIPDKMRKDFRAMKVKTTVACCV